MKVSELMDAVSRTADTTGTEINVAVTKRVVACLFDELAKLDAAEATDVLSKGLAAAKKRQNAAPKKKAARRK